MRYMRRFVVTDDYVWTISGDISHNMLQTQQIGGQGDDYYTVKFHYDAGTGLILGLHPANERQRYFVTMSLIGWVQT